MLRAMSRSAAALLLMVAALPTAYAAAPGNLDELLEQTRTLREREAQINKEREAKFLADRNKERYLLVWTPLESSVLFMMCDTAAKDAKADQPKSAPKK